MNASVRTPLPVALAADTAAVVVFATIGRLSHGEAATPVGVAATAWPFLAGAAAGWLLVLSGLLRGAGVRADLARPRSGVVVWCSCVVFGMVLRSSVAGDGVAPAFVVVATVFTGGVLLGWRMLRARATSRA